MAIVSLTSANYTALVAGDASVAADTEKEITVTESVRSVNHFKIGVYVDTAAGGVPALTTEPTYILECSEARPTVILQKSWPVDVNLYGVVLKENDTHTATITKNVNVF